MDAREMMKEMKAGKFRPIYVLFGADRYRQQQFVQLLSDALFTGEPSDYGIVKLDTSETTLNELVLEAQTPSFFSVKKLIIVRDSYVLCAGKESSKLQQDPGAILQYLEDPAGDAVIVFMVRADKLDERRKLVKKLKERQLLVVFPEMGAEQLRTWLVQYAAKQNRTLDKQAADLLVLRTGTGLQQLTSELDKLCLSVGMGGTVSEAVVRDLTIVTLEENVFSLIDCLVEMRIAQALQIYHDLLQRKEEPIKLVALIVGRVRMMLQIKGLEQQMSANQMASVIGGHPYAIKLAAEKGRKFSTQLLSRMIVDLAELDYRMKQGLVDKAFGLEMFILSLQQNQPVSKNV